MANYTIKSLFHNRLRFAISILGIAIAISLIIIINGFADGFYKQASSFYRNTSSQLIVADNDEGLIGSSSSTLPSELKKQIEKSSGVTKVSEIVFAPVIYKNTPLTLIGYSNKSLGGPWKIKEGRGVTQDNEIVLDQALAIDNGLKVGNKVKMLGSKLKIVGLSAETASFISSLNFISLKKIRQLTNNKDTTSYFLVKSTNVNISENSIKNKLKNNGEVFTNQALGSKEEDDVRQVMSGPINIISLISFLIGLLVVALTAYISALSKINEFTILKAIGAGSKTLFSVVIKQTFINVILGFILGIGLGFLTAKVISLFFPKFLIFITPISITKTLLLSLVMALLASIIPIRKVEIIDPVLVFKS